MTKISRRTQILMNRLREMRAHMAVDQKPAMRTTLARIHQAQRDRGRRDWASELILNDVKIW